MANQELFCDTCTPEVQSNGDIVHEKHCKTQVLHKIVHILKEAGIVTVETAATIATSGLGAMQE